MGRAVGKLAVWSRARSVKGPMEMKRRRLQRVILLTSDMELPVAILDALIMVPMAETRLKVSEEYLGLADPVKHGKSTAHVRDSKQRLARCCFECMGLEIIL